MISGCVGGALSAGGVIRRDPGVSGNSVIDHRSIIGVDILPAMSTVAVDPGFITACFRFGDREGTKEKGNN